MTLLPREHLHRKITRFSSAAVQSWPVGYAMADGVAQRAGGGVDTLIEDANRAALELHAWRWQFSQSAAVMDEWRAGDYAERRGSSVCGMPAAKIKTPCPAPVAGGASEGKAGTPAAKKGVPPCPAQWEEHGVGKQTTMPVPVAPPAHVARVTGSRGVGLTPKMWTGVPRVTPGRESRRLLFLPYIDDSSNLADTVMETEYEFQGRMSRRHEHALAAIVLGRTYALLRVSQSSTASHDDVGGAGVTHSSAAAMPLLARVGALLRAFRTVNEVWAARPEAECAGERDAVAVLAQPGTLTVVPPTGDVANALLVGTEVTVIRPITAISLAQASQAALEGCVLPALGRGPPAAGAGRAASGLLPLGGYVGGLPRFPGSLAAALEAHDALPSPWLPSLPPGVAAHVTPLTARNMDVTAAAPPSRAIIACAGWGLQPSDAVELTAAVQALVPGPGSRSSASGARGNPAIASASSPPAMKRRRPDGAGTASVASSRTTSLRPGGAAERSTSSGSGAPGAAFSGLYAPPTLPPSRVLHTHFSLWCRRCYTYACSVHPHPPLASQADTTRFLQVQAIPTALGRDASRDPHGLSRGFVREKGKVGTAASRGRGMPWRFGRKRKRGSGGVPGGGIGAAVGRALEDETEMSVAGGDDGDGEGADAALDAAGDVEDDAMDRSSTPAAAVATEDVDGGSRASDQGSHPSRRPATAGGDGSGGSEGGERDADSVGSPSLPAGPDGAASAKTQPPLPDSNPFTALPGELMQVWKAAARGLPAGFPHSGIAVSKSGGEPPPCGPACYRRNRALPGRVRAGGTGEDSSAAGGQPVHEVEAAVGDDEDDAALMARLPPPDVLMHAFFMCHGSVCTLAAVLDQPCAGVHRCLSTATATALAGAGSVVDEGAAGDDAGVREGGHLSSPPLLQLWSDHLAAMTASAGTAFPRGGIPLNTHRQSLRAQELMSTSRRAFPDTKGRPVEGCYHEGPCSDNGKCTCHAEGHMCTKACGCDATCPYRWSGCDCRAGGCNSSTCPCWVNGRECDPDLCNHCHASDAIAIACCPSADRGMPIIPSEVLPSITTSDLVAAVPIHLLASTGDTAERIAFLAATTDPTLARWARSTFLSADSMCHNVSFQSRRFAHTTVGPSTIPNAGCGLVCHGGYPSWLPGVRVHGRADLHPGGRAPWHHLRSPALVLPV